MGQEDRQLDVCWLELLPKIIVDLVERAIDAGLQRCTGLERYVTKPVVLSEVTVLVAPHFRGASDEQTQTGDSAKARPQSENGRAGPTEQAGHC